MKSPYYEKYEKFVGLFLPNIEIVDITPSVWHRGYIQIIYIKNNKTYCTGIKEEKIKCLNQSM